MSYDLKKKADASRFNSPLVAAEGIVALCLETSDYLFETTVFLTVDLIPDFWVVKVKNQRGFVVGYL